MVRYGSLAPLDAVSAGNCAATQGSPAAAALMGVARYCPAARAVLATRGIITGFEHTVFAMVSFRSFALGLQGKAATRG
jgi:hypothetical protein